MLVTGDSPLAHILRSRTAPVVSGNEAVSVIITLEDEMAKLNGCVGLAAPQVNIPKSVSIIRYNGVSINLINPSVISSSGLVTSSMEGCMSFPGRRFDVPRFSTIRIRNHILWPTVMGAIPMADDINRKPINRTNPPKGFYLVPTEATYVIENPEEDCGGVICVAVQHEMDHLNGKVLPDRADAKEHYELATGDNKVGRNDPCPCGSGKKFKKCCITRA